MCKTTTHSTNGTAVKEKAGSNNSLYLSVVDNSSIIALPSDFGQQHENRFYIQAGSRKKPKFIL